MAEEAAVTPVEAQLAALQAQLDELIDVPTLAKLLEVETRVVRRGVRKNLIPGMMTIASKTVFEPALALDWIPPDPGVGRGAVRKREDGRRRYIFYATDEELVSAKAAVPNAEFRDPRVIRQERKARKAAEAEGGGAASAATAAAEVVDDDDPFADVEEALGS